ncbi:sigma-70 factor domain-containing protein [Streptomyces sp. NBC_00893]|uniref:sigma-70 factor domain-containing protein n=1 Tax=Streptomyces sp. NBC_00893 TaxID=2975862 RepID=UPI0022528C10|nr:sigma-70 factor domain-containing protein [Streptomyces sp. NBC_00893]MCX4851314.1 hypothetical protein [Streptomyces sp. NBC_00893]
MNATDIQLPEKILLPEHDGTAAPGLPSGGGTVDQVKDYLRLIAQVPLPTAEQEVELSKRTEAGLCAEHLLAEEPGPDMRVRRESALLAEDGRRAKNHFTAADLRLVVAVTKRRTGRGMQLLGLIQEGNTRLIRAVKKFHCAKGRRRP